MPKIKLIIISQKSTKTEINQVLLKTESNVYEKIDKNG